MVSYGGIGVAISIGVMLDDDYGHMEDELLVDRVHQGDSGALDFLIHKYRNFVRAKARTYFLIGADKEDEMKKAQKKFIIRLIAAALVFIIPLIIEFILTKMGFEYNGCAIF